MAEPLLSFRSIRKSFFGVEVLKGVSLDVGAGRIVGLVGENGAGKSTLMNVLGGVHRPDAGTITWDGRPYAPRGPRDAAAAGVAFIHQELNLFANLSVAENLSIGSMPRVTAGRVRLPFVDRVELRRRAREALAPVDPDIDPDAALGELPPGRRQLVEVARALAASARLIILDEPTTSLTAPEAQRLFALMRRLRAERGVSMIYISHNLEDVLELCDDVAVLRDGGLVSAGPREAYTRGRMIAEMVGRAVAHAPGRVAPARSAGAELLRVEGAARPPWVRGVSLSLRAGEVVGVAGLMGAGRSELARLIFGLDRMTGGRVWVGDEAFTPSPRASIARGLAFVTEDRRLEGLLMDAGIFDNAALAAAERFTFSPLRFLRRRPLRAAVDAAAAAVSLRAAGIARQAARTLSGGNQQKLVLGKWLLTRPSIVLLDEPTRGIDVGAKQEVYQVIEGLAAGGAAVLVISSELEELLGLCDRILVMAAGRITAEFPRERFDREQILAAALRPTATAAEGA